MKVTLTDLRKYPEANEILGERAKDYQVMVFIVLTEQQCSLDPLILRPEGWSSLGGRFFLPRLLPPAPVLP